MPYVNSDWKGEVIPVLDLAGAALSTTGWSCEMHIRSAAGVSPALLILTTAAGTLLVGQATTYGSTNGIAVNVPAASMIMTPQSFVWDIKRTDGGRDEWVIGGTGLFEQPSTVIGMT